jgi:hypothetical protein
MIGYPSIVNNADMPEAMVKVAQPLEDDRTVVCDFTPGGMKKNTLHPALQRMAIDSKLLARPGKLHAILAPGDSF